MPDELRLILAFSLAAAAAFAATPLAIAVAGRINFHDRPVGYKAHLRPTPYLGGAAVVIAFVLASVTVGGEFSRLWPIVFCGLGLWVLGTMDDRWSLPPGTRLAVEAGAAIVLWAFDLGWSIFPTDALDLLLTVLWVVGLVNAFNLMDNMDGAAATVGGVAALAVAMLAAIEGDIALAALTVGLSGACVGFLPYNLAAPARIFLGDGGSLPIGFVVAASTIALPSQGVVGWEALLAATLLAGLPVVDTTLVMISRRRYGISLLSGGRDHLTHRLLTRLATPRRVALALGLVQALLGAVAIGVVQLGRGSIITAWTIWFLAAAVAVTLLETEAWTPVRPPPPPPAASRPSRVRSLRRRRPSAVEGVLIVFITAACGLSPFLYGFYDLSVWVPISLMLLASLIGLLVARPALPRRSALVAITGLVALWLWALVSSAWAESADQAVVDATRLMLYATLFAILILLIRDDRLGKLLIGSATLAILALGAYLVAVMRFGDGPSLFLGGRLNEPLGYVNGQAGYLLIGLWPLIALAERARRPIVAGAALASATVLAALVVLAQTRAVIPAVVVSTVVVLALVPGRQRRAWALVVMTLAIAAISRPLLDVYETTPVSQSAPTVEALHRAMEATLLGGLCAGVAWGIAVGGLAAAGDRVRSAGVRVGSMVALLLVLAAGSAAAVVALGNPVERIRDEARAFVELRPGAEGGSRFLSGSGTRHDYWRVALGQFDNHRLAGIGAGNYDTTYYADRRTTENIRQPHSLELQTLAELGVAGGVALLLFLGGVSAGLWSRVRRSRAAREEIGLVVAAAGVFVVWLVHTSVDWLHMIPGVTGMALCGAAVLVSPWRATRVSRSARHWVALGVSLLAILLGALVAGGLALADRYRSQGQRDLGRDPTAAVREANDSLALNDEALDGYYLLSAARARLGDYPAARAALTVATRREPHDFVPWALLGDLATRRGTPAVARRYYRRASHLNPLDEELSALAAGG